MHSDIIIIGGGPAGSTLATLLAREGLTVRLFEKAIFPRDHVGESLLPFCYPVFKDLGVLDEVKKRFSRKPGAQFTSKDGADYSVWCFGHVIEDESYLSFHVLRSEFDMLLLNHAEKSGAHIYQGTRVNQVTRRNPGGWVVNTTDGNRNKTEWTCDFLLDASGQDAFWINTHKIRQPYEGLARSAFATHWTNVKYDEALEEGLVEIVYLGGEKKGWIWMIPLESDRLSVGVALNSDYVKSRIPYYKEKGIENWQEQLYRDELFEAVPAQKILANAQSMQPVMTVSDFSYRTTDQFGADYALVGDAVAFLDPIFSSGIYIALQSATLVSRKIIENHKSGLPLGSDLDQVYKHINGAYKLVEKFIRLFYDPARLDLAGMNTQSNDRYPIQEDAYALTHLLLAGDFFDQYDRYAEFVDMLDNPRVFSNWKSYVKDKHQSRFACGHKPEDIFPDLIHEK